MPQPATTLTLTAGETAMRRVTLRLVPFLCLLFIVNYLDRTNVAMAKLRMLADAGLSERAYGMGAGLFFIGYFLFEVPSNLILNRVGARLWIARIMITWGLLSSALLFTRGPWSFYCLRFALGIAEAGFFPGIIFYLTHWVPHRRRARVLAVFLTSTATSGVIGNPLAGLIMKLDGLADLHGWQWLFLLEGIPAVLLGILILATDILPDDPTEARWLPVVERQWIEDELRCDLTHAKINHVSDLRRAATDGRLWLLSVIYFMLVMGLYGFVFWVPSIVKKLTGETDLMVGLISAIPYMVAVISMVLIGLHADRSGSRRWHVAVCAAIASAGLVCLCASSGSVMGLIWLSIAASGIFGALGPFWAIPTRYLRGTAAAGGIAMINSTGALAGYVAPYAIGEGLTLTGSFTGGLLIVAAALFVGAVLLICIPASIDDVNE